MFALKGTLLLHTLCTRATVTWLVRMLKPKLLEQLVPGHQRSLCHGVLSHAILTIDSWHKKLEGVVPWPPRSKRLSIHCPVFKLFGLTLCLSVMHLNTSHDKCVEFSSTKGLLKPYLFPPETTGEIRDNVLRIGNTEVEVYSPENRMKVPDILFYENAQVKLVLPSVSRRCWHPLSFALFSMWGSFAYWKIVLSKLNNNWLETIIPAVNAHENERIMLTDINPLICMSRLFCAYRR